MTNNERQIIFAEIAKLTNHKSVNVEFVADAWKYKKHKYGEEFADKILNKQLEFVYKN